MSDVEERERKHRIITSRVPPALADEVERAAKKELLTVSSYVRRRLLNAVTGGPGRAAA